MKEQETKTIPGKIDENIKGFYLVYGKPWEPPAKPLTIEDLFRDSRYGKVLAGVYGIEKIPVEWCTSPLVEPLGYRKGFEVSVHFTLETYVDPTAYFAWKFHRAQPKVLGFITATTENATFYRFYPHYTPKVNYVSYISQENFSLIKISQLPTVLPSSVQGDWQNVLNASCIVPLNGDMYYNEWLLNQK